MTDWNVFTGDILKWAEFYGGPLFHAVLTDPPYCLDTITKRFGKEGAAPAQYGKDGLFQRVSKGFMNLSWDNNIAFNPEVWHAIGLLMYPGAFGMAFAGARTYHRIACAIEDAGFIIHSMLVWTYSSGMPKATRIDTQVDKQAGAERDVVGTWKPTGTARRRGGIGAETSAALEGGYKVAHTELEITAPATPLAAAWAGHRYGMGWNKPAAEPIIVFQKPFEGRPLDNMLETGAGAINIDGGRIPTADGYVINRFTDGAKPFGGGAGHPYKTSIENQGRWPANFVLQHTSACEFLGDGWDCHTECPIKHMDAQSGAHHGDEGGASRYFFNGHWYYEVLEQLESADPFLYCSKASTTERDIGLDDEQSTQSNKRRNNHPTIKPISLNRYLATLLLPPDVYAPRRILIPFAGAASEGIGAMLAGWDDITMVELMSEYADVGRKRMRWWQAAVAEHGLSDPAAILKVAKRK